MNACVIVGHGSLRSASGAAMLRLAARLRERGLVDLAEAGFLNYSRPTMADAVEKCVNAGATRIVVQPYFLIDGAYVQNDLPALIAEEEARYPDVIFEAAAPFGAHPALVELTLKRVAAVDPTLGASQPASALLLLAHGTTIPPANRAIEEVAAAVGEEAEYDSVGVAYLDLNQPTIPDALDALAADGYGFIVTMPYFLHQGRHVAEDVPALLEEAAARWPDVIFAHAEHLGYDLLLADLIAERIASVIAPAPSLYPITLTRLAESDVLVVGGGTVGERKIARLLEAGAQVRLVSPQATSTLRAWAGAGRIGWQARPYAAGDIGSALLVFAATDEREVNAAVAADAHAAGCLINVADAPGDGNFHVPAVPATEDAVVAVSTRAGDPRRAQRLRNRIAQALADDAESVTE